MNNDKNNNSSINNRNSDNNTNILNNSHQQRFNYDSISNSNINNNNNDETMYREQMLANYQIKRSESNFGNLNNDYSRFSDNNIININNKNQNINENYNPNNKEYKNQIRNISNIPSMNNLIINPINTTNRSSDFNNDKSVLISPHFSQINQQNMISNIVNYKQNNDFKKNNFNYKQMNFEEFEGKENPSRRSIKKNLFD